MYAVKLLYGFFCSTVSYIHYTMHSEICIAFFAVFYEQYTKYYFQFGNFYQLFFITPRDIMAMP